MLQPLARRRTLLASTIAALALLPFAWVAYATALEAGPSSVPVLALALILPVAAAAGACAPLASRFPTIPSLALASAVMYASLVALSGTLALRTENGVHLGVFLIAAMLMLAGLPAWIAAIQYDESLVARPTEPLWRILLGKGKGAMALYLVGYGLLAGAYVGFLAVKDNAMDANARNRILSASAIVEEYAAANEGRYPDAATFATIWRTKRPDDATISPWGGDLAERFPSGVEPATDLAGDAGSPEAARAAAEPVPAPDKAGVMLYVRIPAGPAGPWRGLRDGATGAVVPVKGYAVGLYGKRGQPWWGVKGGR